MTAQYSPIPQFETDQRSHYSSWLDNLRIYFVYISIFCTSILFVLLPVAEMIALSFDNQFCIDSTPISLPTYLFVSSSVGFISFVLGMLLLVFGRSSSISLLFHFQTYFYSYWCIVGLVCLASTISSNCRNTDIFNSCLAYILMRLKIYRIRS
jgi:hypothetical protein